MKVEFVLEADIFTLRRLAKKTFLSMYKKWIEKKQET